MWTPRPSRRYPGPDLVAALTALVFGLWGCSAADESAATCRKRNAQVGIGATFNICPDITTLDVLPRQAMIGGELRLTASTVDDDSSNLAYLWTASVGSVSDPSAPLTTYRCVAAGIVTLQLTVSDGLCEDTMSTAAVCGCGTSSGGGPICDGGRSP